MSSSPNPADAVYKAARARIKVPAGFLLLTGIVNLILAGFLGFAALRVISLGDRERQELVLDFWNQLNESQRERLRSVQGATESEDLSSELGHVLLLATTDVEVADNMSRGVDKLIVPLLANGTVGVLIACLTTYIAIQMFRLRAYRGCQVASTAAIVLIVAPTVVFLFGYLFGLWDTSTQFAYLLPTCCGGVGAFINGPSLIWCLSVLRSPGVREAFDRRGGAGKSVGSQDANPSEPK